MGSAANAPASLAMVTFDELVRHNEEENAKWRAFFKQNRDAIALPCDFAGMHNVGGVLLHIFAVELLYAERLVDMQRERLSYEDFPNRTLEELFSNHDRAIEHIRAFMARATEADWKQVATFETKTSGVLSGTKRKLLLHLLMHSIRHWAQMATFLRRAGFRQEWGHDFIFSDVMP